MCNLETPAPQSPRHTLPNMSQPAPLRTKQQSDHPSGLASSATLPVTFPTSILEHSLHCPPRPTQSQASRIGAHSSRAAERLAGWGR